MNIVTDNLDVFRESCLKTLCTLFICQKPVIKCERIDNGVLSMLGCGLRWCCSSLIPSPHTTAVLCCT